MSRKTVVILVLLALGLATPIVIGVLLGNQLAAKQPAPPNLLGPLALGRGATLGIATRGYLREHREVKLETFELTMLTEGEEPRVRPSDLLDPWGRAFEIVRYEDDEFEIRSLGADGKEGGSGEARDIVVPGPPNMSSARRTARHLA